MDIQQGTFAASFASLVDGNASTQSVFPTFALSDAKQSTASTLSAQAAALLLGLLLLLIGCLA
ncbi:MAG: hypothetical protein GX342_02705 [Alcaligenaceae bacterium]|jgi:hypothetical protein|nr:hypothetical protein [Alcaligenaceae bacterium]